MLEVEGSTFLEDFQTAVEHLPNDVRRDFELMKELDRDSAQSLRDLTEAERKSMKSFKNNKMEGISIDMATDDDFVDLSIKRSRIRQKQEEKVAVAVNMLETVEKFVKKLDSDLTIFETQLRGAGSFEQGGAEPGQEVAIKSDIYSSDWILGRVIFYPKSFIKPVRSFTTLELPCVSAIFQECIISANFVATNVLVAKLTTPARIE